MLLLSQGPLVIGPGCLLSGLNVDSSPALRGCPLHDIVLQGHHVRLRDLPCRVFTLTGRLDDWQVRGRCGGTGLLEKPKCDQPLCVPAEPCGKSHLPERALG